ncbi:MAG: hypothetical protein M3Y54_16530 [Bacteroidota bacterium]|nr:hypothetical protein [Bacteroidota bacterium]
MRFRSFCCLALLLGLGATRPASAQTVNWPVYAGFYLQGGGSYYAGLKLDSYEQYRESFNTVFKTRLRTPLGAWTPQLDYSFGGGAYIGPACFSVVKHRMQVSSVAEYLNGDRREMTLDYNPLDLNFDLLFPVGGRVGVGAAIGGQLQNVTVHSGYRYAANGLLSYGEEQPLNGVFRQKVTGSLLLGARLDLKLIKLHDHAFITLSLRGESVGVLRHFIEGSDPNVNPLRDEMMAQATGGPTFDDGTLRYYLPEDVRKRRDDYTTFVGLNPTFASTLHGWRFSANLLFTPFERRLNK